MYQKMINKKTKRKASQDLIGVQNYEKYVAKEGGKAIVSGFSHKKGVYDVEHDAFPQGMSDLKKQAKQRFLQEVSLRERLLKDEIAQEEDYIQQQTQKESFNL